jgi:hypothetical protein
MTDFGFGVCLSGLSMRWHPLNPVLASGCPPSRLLELTACGENASMQLVASCREETNVAINRVRVRKLHRWFAPIMALPLLLTLLTGMSFQIAIATGNGGDFLWLLDLHRGKFGSINLELVYPFLNGLGLLTLVVSGVLMWFQTGK